MEIKLSICVVTMNRADQLKEALESCFACNLPSNTEFVIIDNASTDATEQVVKESFRKNIYSFIYEKMKVNLGCGGGRNYAYNKTTGEYIYMLDDDAVVDSENVNFFVDALKLLDSNKDIITLTTQIYDTVWKRNRVESYGRKISSHLYECMMFCGGSHFIRKSFFESSPYLSNKYGYEELYPSLMVTNAKKMNVFVSNLLIIHKPRVNKWNYNVDEQAKMVLLNGYAVMYAIKKMMYPNWIQFILWLVFKARQLVYLSRIKGYRKKSRDIIKYTVDNYFINSRISNRTFFYLLRYFKQSSL